MPRRYLLGAVESSIFLWKRESPLRPDARWRPSAAVIVDFVAAVAALVDPRLPGLRALLPALRTRRPIVAAAPLPAAAAAAADDSDDVIEPAVAAAAAVDDFVDRRAPAARDATEYFGANGLKTIFCGCRFREVGVCPLEVGCLSTVDGGCLRRLTSICMRDCWLSFCFEDEDWVEIESLLFAAARSLTAPRDAEAAPMEAASPVAIPAVAEEFERADVLKGCRGCDAGSTIFPRARSGGTARGDVPSLCEAAVDAEREGTFPTSRCIGTAPCAPAAATTLE